MFRGSLTKLRAYKKEDVPKAQEFLNDWEIRKNLAPNIPFPFTLEDEQKWYDGNSAMNDKYNFAIETLEDGYYIGGCGINNIDWRNSVALIGIYIGEKDFLGKGYGTDAMKVLINFIFSEVNINKISLRVYSFNERAIRSYEKCGFKTEGVLRQEIFREGKYYDIIVMGLLKEEFTKE